MTEFGEIQDSGVRQEFETGSVRDTREGKGRFDLIGSLASMYFPIAPVSHPLGEAINALYEYLAQSDISLLGNAYNLVATNIDIEEGCSGAYLTRLARHYEGGAKKYDARNWEKGQDVMRYFDSAVRHLTKAIQGQTDEDHKAAALWNIIGFAHTLEMIERALLPSILDNRPRYFRT